jgi:DNA excision repair protein ERCC-2
MKFKLDDMTVYFPFKDLYREQKEYMEGLKKILDQDGKGILEMPTGTGKTASLLSFVVSYQLAFPTRYKKLIYCTRTFAELEKTISELKVVVDYVKAEFPKKENERILKAGMEEQLKSIAQKDTGDLNIKGKGKRGFKQQAEVKKNTRILTSENILAFGISARRGLCINEEVSQFTEREKVDSECQRRTAMWVRAETMKSGVS